MIQPNNRKGTTSNFITSHTALKMLPEKSPPSTSTPKVVTPATELTSNRSRLTPRTHLAGGVNITMRLSQMLRR